jgi:hypothetical protein
MTIPELLVIGKLNKFTILRDNTIPFRAAVACPKLSVTK